MDSRSADIVVPVYNNENTLRDLLGDLENLRLRLEADENIIVRAIFVLDGTPDNSEATLLSLTDIEVIGEIYRLEKNVGALEAVRFGVTQSKADATAICSADRQEPISLMRDLIVRTLENEWMSCGVRQTREDASIFSSLFWKFAQRQINPNIPSSGVDIFALSARARDLVLASQSPSQPITTLLFTFQRAPESIPYDRRIIDLNRKSGWSLRAKLSYAIDTIFGFSELPMKLAYRVVLAQILIMIATFLGLCSTFLTNSSPNLSALAIVALSFTLTLTFLAMIILAYVRQIYLANTRSVQPPATVIFRQES